MELSEIFIYPVKSLAGISLLSSNVMDKGLEYDRRWMIVDSNGRFLTQREIPTMALIQPEIIGGILRLKLGEATIEMEEAREGKHTSVEVWSDKVQAYETSPLIDEWLSDQLHYECSLVKMTEGEVSRTKLDKPVSFADGYPYLVLGNASLKDLNERLEEAVGMQRFRPNLVFNGGHAFEEDVWNEFRIGEVDFYGVKPCARCSMTTVNPETAETGKEPLATLSRYRKKDNNVLFGLNAFAASTGNVEIGDKITVKSKRQ